MNFQHDARLSVHRSIKLSAKWAMLARKTNRMNFLNRVFQRSKFFLASFLEIHLVEEKGEIKLYCELEIGMYKKIILTLLVRCTNMRKCNCGVIIRTSFIKYDRV